MSALYMTLVGVVGTVPRLGQFDGTPVLSFRMVATERRFDKPSQAWIDVHSSWVSVSCFRRLARNVGESIQKGDRLIVHGKVKVKDYRTEAGEVRTAVDVEALNVGHDLSFGTSRFTPALPPENADERLRRQAEEFAREQAELPRESVAELVAQRAAAGLRPGPVRGHAADLDDAVDDAVLAVDDSLEDDLDDDLEDDLDDELDDELDDLEEEGDRRAGSRLAAAVG